MKRRALKLLLFLLAGAIINVAVAWGCAFLLPDQGEFQDYGELDRQKATRIWQRFGRREVRPSGAPVDLTGYVMGNAWWRFVIVVDDADGIAPYSPDGFGRDSIDEIWETQCGWPARSMCSQTWTDDWSVHAARLLPSLKTVHVHDELDGSSWVPCQILFPGFAINTIFYAAIVWTLFAVPGYIRRRRRIKRGLCARCAYPLGTGSVCSECGTPVQSRKPDLENALR